MRVCQSNIRNEEERGRNRKKILHAMVDFTLSSRIKRTRRKLITQTNRQGTFSFPIIGHQSKKGSLDPNSRKKIFRTKSIEDRLSLGFLSRLITKYSV